MTEDQVRKKVVAATHAGKPLLMDLQLTDKSFGYFLNFSEPFMNLEITRVVNKLLEQ